MYLKYSAHVSLAFTLLIGGPAPAQEKPDQPQAVLPEFRADTAVVVLDVIVRDKKGRPVRDLRPEEVQVFEDGARCEVRSFRRVASEPLISSKETTTLPSAPTDVAPPTAADAGISDDTRFPFNLVTIVFDLLDNEGNRLAREAALHFVERGLNARSEAAVFKLGRRMAVVQQYTSDKGALREAVELATSVGDLTERARTKKAWEATQDYVRILAARSGDGAAAALSAQAQTTGDASEAADDRLPPGAENNVDDTEMKRRQLIAYALRTADSLQRQTESETSLYPLLALAKAQASIPGRKTILFSLQVSGFRPTSTSCSGPSSARPTGRTSASMPWTHAACAL